MYIQNREDKSRLRAEKRLNKENNSETEKYQEKLNAESMYCHKENKGIVKESSGDEILFEIKSLSKTYGKGDKKVQALKNIDLKIMRGDICGIIGISGAGKSTLLRSFNLLEKPDQGQILFKNRDLRKLSKQELAKERRKIGMIFQNFNLLKQRSAFENVRFPLEIAKLQRAEADRKALQMLRLVGLEDKKNAYISQLSGGQAQRVAIARALAADPEVILCDEATSALDRRNTDEILQILKQINKKLGVTIIFITHDTAVVEALCDKLIVLDAGEIVEEGNCEDIFQQPVSKVARSLILPIETTNSFDKLQAVAL